MYLPLKYLTNCNGPQKCQLCCCCWCWCCKVQELPEIIHIQLQIQSVYLCICCELQFQLQLHATLHAVSTNFTLFLDSVDYDDEGLRCAAVTGEWNRVAKRLEIFYRDAKRSHEIHLLLQLYDTNSADRSPPCFSFSLSLCILPIASCRSEQSCQLLGGRYSSSLYRSFEKKTRLKKYLL